MKANSLYMTHPVCHIGHCDWLYTYHAITKCKVMYYTHAQDTGTSVLGYFNVLTTMAAIAVGNRFTYIS